MNDSHLARAVARGYSAGAGATYPVLGPVSKALASALKGMDWLTPADDAAVEVARHYAAIMDASVASGDIEIILKAQNYGPHLKNILNDLGGTPRSRGALEGTGAGEDPLEASMRDFQARAKARKKQAA